MLSTSLSFFWPDQQQVFANRGNVAAPLLRFSFCCHKKRFQVIFGRKKNCFRNPNRSFGFRSPSL